MRTSQQACGHLLRGIPDQGYRYRCEGRQSAELPDAAHHWLCQLQLHRCAPSTCLLSGPPAYERHHSADLVLGGCLLKAWKAQVCLHYVVERKRELYNGVGSIHQGEQPKALARLLLSNAHPCSATVWAGRVKSRFSNLWCCCECAGPLAGGPSSGPAGFMHGMMGGMMPGMKGGPAAGQKAGAPTAVLKNGRDAIVCMDLHLQLRLACKCVERKHILAVVCRSWVADNCQCKPAYS